ncbi:unnamed protein product [Anisakis simplex]|uniref:Female germline-specific tumor suppressor gld-1 (inferred by orthology to a C. elegans protein) n=1 Tax=Anisakis simplex TaxID=6269 RepID=A0A0M3JX93_ANISI|nr:unnamed protein product [Anisakis simplex]
MMEFSLPDPTKKQRQDQQLVKLFKSIDANCVTTGQKSIKKSPYSLHSEKGSLNTKDKMASDCTIEYLAELMQEKRQLEVFPHLFPNIERLIDDEIAHIRVVLFQWDFSIEKANLPDPEGDPIIVQEKVYVPSKEHPDYNFIGRILGPRGMTAKQLAQETGCKIMVRGRGSMRDSRKEEQNRGKPNWEHLNEDLHVVVQCEDTPNRVHMKLKTGVEQIKKLLVPSPEDTDDLKRKQLMELAIINGTYKPASKCASQGVHVLATPVTLVSPMHRSSPITVPTRQFFVSPVGSPIASAENVTSSTSLHPFVQSPNYEYNMFLSQIPYETSLAALSLNGEYQSPYTTAPVNGASLMNATPLPKSLQPYFIDSTTITPPASTGSDHR